MTNDARKFNHYVFPLFHTLTHFSHLNKERNNDRPRLRVLLKPLEKKEEKKLTVDREAVFRILIQLK